MKLIKVAIAIVTEGNKILVAKRDAKQHQGGLWEFPGGKVELDETFEQAALRELAEEVGVIADSAESIWQTEHDYGDRIVKIEAFLVSEWRGEAFAKEGNPVRWVTLEELTELPMPAANEPLLQLLQQRLG